jgi:hypothetical protein
MNREEIIARLRENKAALRARGVANAALFDGRVDLANRDALKPYVKPAATADPIYAFLRLRA